VRSEGFEVLKAPNGPAALPVAAKYVHEIDLLPTDVEMPEMNGRRLSEDLVRVRPELKTFYFSG
jgi:two-component system, cell cycle sensor histidine kinase and response regulator CckA